MNAAAPQADGISPLAFIRRFWKSKRVRIILTAVLVGAVAGVIKLGLPLEDLLAGTRASIRYEVADQEIVVVELDDKTLAEMDVLDPPRSADAQLIQNLVEGGAKRIFFDRSYRFAEDDTNDGKLLSVLEKNPGKVFFGAFASEDNETATSANIGPHEKFRGYVGLVSMIGIYHPFKMFVSFPFRSPYQDGYITSFSATLANVSIEDDGIFRPDYAIDVDTIPSYSYVDVWSGKVPADQFSGRDILVAPAALTYNDIHEMPSQGFMPGAYFQVVAAQTLKRGIPVDLGWIPAFLIALAIVVSGIGRGRALDRYRLAGLTAILMLVPLALDAYGIFVEVVPAAAMAMIAAFRARALDRVEAASEINILSGLPSLQSLRAASATIDANLVALKIRNYGAITGSFARPVEQILATEIQRRIRISEPDATIFHDGDMFVWASNFANLAELTENLEGLHSLLQNGIRIDDRDIDLSFNAGVDSARSAQIKARIANAMQSAEEALHNDELVRHNDDGQNDTQWQVSLLSSLDRAIDCGEVWVAYQPKLELSSMRITGAEALVRWTHPERGPISPDQFITLAEQYHRIERITRFVVNEAVRAASSIVHQGHDFTVSVNISAQLLRSASLPTILSEALFMHDLAPEHLVLEITETDRMDRSSTTLEMMNRLVEAGLQLSIDDFGTGNATIDYLRYLPAKEVKIDKGFVSDIEKSREDYLLVQSIIEMSHSLDRRVVAEGVENQAVLDLLRGMSCDQAQGFHISQPIRFDELTRMLRAERVKDYG